MQTSRLLGLVVVWLVGGSLRPAHAETNEAIVRAMASVREAAPRAEADPTRPIYHFRPPANWNNDPNGPIYHRGYYHLFYQHNPYGDAWDQMHWGHARSRDLVHWEHLPIALRPSKELGEDHVFSGCATLAQGRPFILYTSIGRGKGAGDHAEQWAALGDDSLITWRKHPSNPVMTEALHGAQKVYDWRDPFIFRHRGKTYAVLGGNLNQGKGGQAVVNLYEAETLDLTRWKYLGVLFTHPDPQVKNIECPNFFPLGDRWLLVVSPQGQVEYFVGHFDAAAGRFTPETRGIMDAGNYYAPNCLLDPHGRRLMWGWVNGFKEGRGWNGCMTLPRRLSLDSRRELVQTPAPGLRTLRAKLARESRVYLRSDSRVLSSVRGDALELLAEFEPGDAKSFGLEVRRSDDGRAAITIACEENQLDVAGTKASLPPALIGKRLRLHVFLDQSVVEVYANDRVCLTKVVYPPERDLGVALFARDGSATVRSVKAWNLRLVW